MAALGSVSSAGDVNGDGFDDLILGARSGSPLDRMHAGESYVIYGKEGGPGRLDLATLTAAQGFRIVRLRTMHRLQRSWRSARPATSTTMASTTSPSPPHSGHLLCRLWQAGRGRRRRSGEPGAVSRLRPSRASDKIERRRRHQWRWHLRPAPRAMPGRIRANRDLRQGRRIRRYRSAALTARGRLQDHRRAYGERSGVSVSAPAMSTATEWAT